MNTNVEMIVQHFVPTILRKYTSYILRDSTLTKTLFNQSFNRLRQLFRSDSLGRDPATGKPQYRSGLQPLYFKAKKQGLKFSIMKAVGGDQDTGVGDMLSSSGFDEQIENVTNYIIMNINPNYSKQFLDFVNEESKIKLANIEKVVKLIHTHKYADEIREIIELTFSRLAEIQKAKFCSPGFLKDVIKKKIISSKHTTDVIKLKEVVDILLANVLDDNFEKQFSYNNWSNTQKSQWRRIIIYSIGYNIQRQICFS
ncbi:MAG: hypothetical protein H8D97_01160 [Proteobacteria bacterium]|nr:hypothetical protein [Pseudomonadota bacterium]